MRRVEQPNNGRNQKQATTHSHPPSILYRSLIVACCSWQPRRRPFCPADFPFLLFKLASSSVIHADIRTLPQTRGGMSLARQRNQRHARARNIAENSRNVGSFGRTQGPP